MVFEVGGWQPQPPVGVVGRAILGGFIGLTGTLVPYMLPLLLLLSAMVRVLMGAVQPFLL